MKLTKNKILSLILIFFLSFLIILTSVCPTIVRADNSGNYSGVLMDLKKDESFDIQDYPSMTLDYINSINSDLDLTNDQPLMEVISIAEGVDDNLFIYVYQPTDLEINLTASSVLLSLDNSPDGQNLNLDIYDLELVSTSSVFDKYLVKDFIILEEVYRYYNIVTLYRNFDSRIDEVVSGSEAEGAEIGIEVGQQWCVYYYNNSIVYEKGTFETVDVSINFVGNINFQNGITWGSLAGLYDSGDAWFVTFNVEDYIVSKIYDADLTYKIRSIEETWAAFVGTEYKYGEFSNDIKVTLTESDKGSYIGKGIFSRDFIWNRISSSASLLSSLSIQNIKLSDDCVSALENSQWAFCFLETERSFISGDGYWAKSYSDIEDVTIIRLHFIDILGSTYNLGVVSDRVNPDNLLDGNSSGLDFDWKRLLKLILGLVLIVFLLNILISSGALNLIFNVIIWIITAPFKFIKWLIDKFRGD